MNTAVVALTMTLLQFSVTSPVSAADCDTVARSAFFEQVGGQAVINGEQAPMGTDVAAWFGDMVVGCGHVSSAGDFVMTVYGHDATGTTAMYPNEGDSLTMKVNAESAVVAVSSGAVMSVHYPTLLFEHETSWLVRVDAGVNASKPSASLVNGQIALLGTFACMCVLCLGLVLQRRAPAL